MAKVHPIQCFRHSEKKLVFVLMVSNFIVISMALWVCLNSSRELALQIFGKFLIHAKIWVLVHVTRTHAGRIGAADSLANNLARPDLAGLAQA